MAKKRLMPLDMTKLEILNLRLHQSAGDPATPVEGQIWWDSTAHLLMVRSNSASINPLARANHSGSQTASTISDLATVVQAYRLDQFAAPTADLSINSHKLTNVTDPTGAQDAATKNYVDGVVQGFSWKQLPVKAATTANGTLATAFANGQVIDGVTLATGDRILLKNQTAGQENGIYTVNASGAPTRATDADTTAELRNATVWVSQGSTLADTAWDQTAEVTTVGTTAQTWAQVGGGSSYTAGNGLQLVGSVFSAVAFTGISVTGSGIAVDTAVVVRKYAVAFGDGSTLSYTITHNLGTQDVTVAVYQNSSTWDEVECDVLHATTNTVTLVFAVAPTTNQYRAVVHG